MTSSSLLAADGELVPDFGDNGIAQAGITDAYTGETGGPIVQTDGSIVYCSTRATAGPSGRDFVVLRLTPDGQPDDTFNFSGRVDIDFGGDDDECSGIAVQSDGKIVLVGTTVASNNASKFAVARLTADGSLDGDFGSGTGKQVIDFDAYNSTGNHAQAVALQPDGSIVVAGRLLSDFQRDFARLRRRALTCGWQLRHDVQPDRSPAHCFRPRRGRRRRGVQHRHRCLRSHPARRVCGELECIAAE